MTGRIANVLLAVALSAGTFVPAGAGEPAEVWWSFRPLQTAVPPGLQELHPIDAFVRARQRELGLRYNPEADQRTLLRRLSLDLIGLPPTPEELADFEADRLPGAYERQVERLLASPHHGERWARHWLDTVHFAETHGHDQDRIRPSAWRYRDYLVDAFNADTPYARFVQEQLAADVLFPDAPERITALGFLAAGPWDESSLRDIREDSIDRQIGHYLDRDDMVMTVMTTFQSLSVHCARCHDHKLDPIDTADYYALQAVFAGVGRGEIPFEQLGIRQQRQAIEQQLARLEQNTDETLRLLDAPQTRAEVAAWAAKLSPSATTWKPLELLTLKSDQGATLTRGEAGTVRSEGKRPEKDSYHLTARIRQTALTGIRLEVLPDAGLPQRGPGRQDNGNLHLSEFRATIAPLQGDAAGPSRPIAFRAARADYDQPGWTIAHAIDGKPATAWGIYPQVGKPHEATFTLAEPLPAGDWELAITLDQLHGGGHLIGRFRLSHTAMPTPASMGTLAPGLADLLRAAPETRTVAQWHTLGRHYLREKLQRELSALPASLTVYGAGPNFKVDGSHRPVVKPRAVHVLRRGDIRKPGAEAHPGSVNCLPGLAGRLDVAADAGEGQRRAALARWITHPDNPLTWRSIVNRVWHYHFGRGLVDTPGEFGKLGSKPTHPELLDWLALWFRDRGGSLKDLHRLIVTSATYRQTAVTLPEQRAIDADNRFLARMPRLRLDAEQTRDAILQVAGRLNQRMTGESDRQFALRPGIHVTPIVEYGKFDWDRPEGHRRSLYRFQFRTLPDPLVECLDGPDASQLTPTRNVSVTAPQALALLNNEFVLVHARALAERLEREHPARTAQIRRLSQLLWLRPVTDVERADLEAHAQRHGLANLCRVLLNSNEFLFTD